MQRWPHLLLVSRKVLSELVGALGDEVAWTWLPGGTCKKEEGDSRREEFQAAEGQAEG